MNRNWDRPDLNEILILISFVLFCSFYLITHSQAAFVNWLYVARLTIVHSRTQINQVSIIIFIIINKRAVTVKTSKLLVDFTENF